MSCSTLNKQKGVLLPVVAEQHHRSIGQLLATAVPCDSLQGCLASGAMGNQSGAEGDIDWLMKGLAEGLVQFPQV